MTPHADPDIAYIQCIGLAYTQAQAFTYRTHARILRLSHHAQHGPILMFALCCAGYSRRQLCHAGEEGQEAESQPLQGVIQWLVQLPHLAAGCVLCLQFWC